MSKNKTEQRFSGKKTVMLAGSIAVAMGMVSHQANAAVDYPSSTKINQMTQDAPAPLKGALSAQEKVLNVFDAGYGLQGYVVDAGGQNPILYYDKEKDFAFSGVILDKHGRNVSQQHYAEQIPKQDYSEVLTRLEKSGNFMTEGAEDATAEIYVIFDPSCPHCHSFYENTRSFVKDGSLKIHWTPVAFLSQKSVGKVAKMLQSDNPIEMFIKDSDSYRSGGIAPLSDSEIQEATTQMTQENVEFMRAFDSTGTPTIIYKTPNEKVYTISSSLPEKEIADLIQEIAPENK